MSAQGGVIQRQDTDRVCGVALVLMEVGAEDRRLGPCQSGGAQTTGDQGWHWRGRAGINQAGRILETDAKGLPGHDSMSCLLKRDGRDCGLGPAIGVHSAPSSGSL